MTLATYSGFIRGILRGVRYAKSLRVLFLHRRSPSWTTLVLYSRVVFIFNEPTISLKGLTGLKGKRGCLEIPTGPIPPSHRSLHECPTVLPKPPTVPTSWDRDSDVGQIKSHCQRSNSWTKFRQKS
jgi:hypothetical protein